MKFFWSLMFVNRQFHVYDLQKIAFAFFSSLFLIEIEVVKKVKYAIKFKLV